MPNRTNPNSCRVCDHPVQDVPRIVFAARTLPTPATICIDCMDQWMLTHPVNNGGSLLRRYVEAYIEDNTDPVKLLKRKVKELEERLARANSTIANLNPQHR